MQQTGTPWNAFRTAEQIRTYWNGNVQVTPDEEISVAVLSSGGSSMYNRLSRKLEKCQIPQDFCV
ncbi:MAG: hypothetical protein K6F80_02185 [Oscillospiraceae bacterium]|nr:hypothetical protein [Oscillospiraceae bacterium]